MQETLDTQEKLAGLPAMRAMLDSAYAVFRAHPTRDNLMALLDAVALYNRTLEHGR